MKTKKEIKERIEKLQNGLHPRLPIVAKCLNLIIIDTLLWVLDKE